jgi:hypothetical protein
MKKILLSAAVLLAAMALNSAVAAPYARGAEYTIYNHTDLPLYYYDVKPLAITAALAREQGVSQKSENTEMIAPGASTKVYRAFPSMASGAQLDQSLFDTPYAFLITDSPYDVVYDYVRIDGIANRKAFGCRNAGHLVMGSCAVTYRLFDANEQVVVDVYRILGSLE